MGKEITFDKFARWTIIALICVALWFVISYLSDVLLPFVLAWFLAYLLYPLVKLIENKLHIHIRPLSIFIAIIIALSVISGILWLIIPPMVEQFETVGKVVVRFIHNSAHITNIPDAIDTWINNNQKDIERFFRSDDFTDTIKTAMPKIFNVLGETWSIVVSVIGSCITLLYMFFILMDYEYLSESWIRIFPKSMRPFWKELMGDVEVAMNSYIRGQSMVAFIMAILFAIGFTIIGFPMAIGLAVLIGILDLVPYLHTFALIPTAILALLKASETGQNFWVILASAVAVFCIVQVIIDMVVVPKVMGKAMGLNPAILLLALSVWGALFGFIGLIIALPATTIIMAYWARYISKNE